MYSCLTEISNVLVIGCGGAGIRAAIETKQKNLDVQIIGKRSKVDAHKHLYYDDYIENDSVFNDQSYSKKIHTSKNPKSQLTEAVKESFGQWAKKVVFMGADSMELTSKDINLVFKQLNHHHVVILPELNGGILLFGLTLFRSDIFDHFPWETENDLLDTIINLQRNKNTYCVLEAKSAYD